MHGGKNAVRILSLRVGDTLEMKKPHPCGSDRFLVKRVGSDVRVLCLGCGRDITVPRVKLEHGIRRVMPKDGEVAK